MSARKPVAQQGGETLPPCVSNRLARIDAARAGPVVVGAVIFPEGFNEYEGIADSKLLTELQRKKLANHIKKGAEHGITLKFLKADLPEYRQFNQPFVQGLSIIDTLMFNPPAAVASSLDAYHLS